MRFREDMGCCNSFREQAGLACSVGSQVTCAQHELKRLAEHAPDSVAPFLRKLLVAFPHNTDWLFRAAEWAGVADEFIDRSAQFCAAFPSHTEREQFRARIFGYMSSEQIERFNRVGAVEWARLRNLHRGNQK
jgi:hypothetical protein